jgi:hypothetical protein
MTKTTMFEGPFGEIAVHESEGVGRPIVLIPRQFLLGARLFASAGRPAGRFAPSRRDRPDSLKLPTLWRGATQVIAEAGHAPHWECPEEFDALLRAFAADCGT